MTIEDRMNFLYFINTFIILLFLKTSVCFTISFTSILQCEKDKKKIKIEKDREI